MKGKTIVLGLCIYFCPTLFERLGHQWYPKDENGQSHLGSISDACLLRERFWKAVFWSFVIIALTLIVSVVSGHPPLELKDFLRVSAVFVALIAVLGRGGWDIQTWKGKTVVERVDRMMYYVTQLGVAALLVFIITME